MTPTKTLAVILDPRKNSFNFLRIIAALCVLVSHSFTIPVGTSGVEPLVSWTPFSLGQHAVNLFFIISGLTLSNSIERNPDIVHYAWARFLRIFPGLFVFGLLFAFVAGPLLTSSQLREYFSDPHTWLYPATVLVQFSRATAPNGIFSHLPIAGDVNNPLWTLKYELIAYVVLAIIFSFSYLRRTSSLLVALALSLAVFVSAPYFVEKIHFGSSVYQLGRYEFCFLIGVIAFRFRDRISLSPWYLPISLALVVACRGTIFDAPSYVVLTAHLVIILGGLDYGIFSSASRDADLSYGTYIYGWPVQQSLVAFVPGIGVYSLLAASMLIVPIFALASWHWVEKPILGLKKIDPRSIWSRMMVGNALAKK